MNIDISKLLSGHEDEIKIENMVHIDNSYLKNTEIRQLNDIFVTGNISKISNDNLVLNMHVEGIMVLPCSVTLEDVDYPFCIEIDEICTENEQENEEYVKINENTIDILPIIWQNIVMEIPLKVVSPKLDRRNISGVGWKLIEENSNKEEI
jgi:uncharacterized protein